MSPEERYSYLAGRFLDMGGLGLGAGLAMAAAPGRVPTTASGPFSINDWAGYPQGVPRPQGPFTLLEGTDYANARAAANNANRALRQADPAAYAGRQIHEIQPVKFGGSPTDPANKVPLSPPLHSQVTNWWNSLMRNLSP